MSTHDERHDDQFRELFRHAGVESPSGDFTERVMQQVAQLDAAALKGSQENPRSSWYWGIGMAALLVLGVSIMYYFNLIQVPENFKNILSPVFSGIIRSFEGIFSSVEVSSTTIVIILGFVLLVVVERILNKLKLTRNIYLSF